MTKPFGIWGGAKPFYLNQKLDMNSQLDYMRKLRPEIYCHIIYKERDLYALEDLLARLQAPYWEPISNLQIWPVLLPPTEGLSEPFSINWRRWAKVFRSLHELYPQLTGIVIDDFNCYNPNLSKDGVDNFVWFDEPSQQKELIECQRILKEGNIKLYLVVYENKILWTTDRFELFETFVSGFPGGRFKFDGLIVPWMNLCSSNGLENSLRRVREAFPDKTLIGMIYGSSTSWHLYPPEPQVYAKATLTTYAHSDAIVNYCVPDKGPVWRITKGLFKKWSEQNGAHQM